MPKLIALTLILSFFISGVNSATAFDPQSEKYDVCPVTATLSDARLIAANPMDLTAMQVLGVSYYDNGGTDVSQVTYSMFTTPNSNPISWTILLVELIDASHSYVPSTTTFITTQSTSQPEVLGFLKKTLVIKQTSVSSGGITTIAYNALRVGETAVINLLQPTGQSSITFTAKYVAAFQEIIPSVHLYMQGKTGNTIDFVGFYRYSLDSYAPVAQELAGSYTVGALPNRPSPDTIVGNQMVYVDPLLQSGQIYELTGTGYATTNFIPLGISISTALIYSHWLNYEVTSLVFVQSDRTLAKFAIKKSTSLLAPYTVPTGSTVRVITDNVQNLLLVNDRRIFWIKSPNNINNNPFVTSLTPDNSGLDSDIYSTDNMRVAGDKAFALYSTKIAIFRHIPAAGAGSIQAFSTVALNSNFILPSSDFNVQLVIGCQCSVPTLTRLSCFSASLTCIVTANKRWASCS